MRDPPCRRMNCPCVQMAALETLRLFNAHECAYGQGFVRLGAHCGQHRATDSSVWCVIPVFKEVRSAIRSWYA